MTARETTLGALTAADLGESARVIDAANIVHTGTLEEVKHSRGWRDESTRTLVSVVYPGGAQWTKSMPSDTPVTVYDEEDEA
jgi:hypothetical protein